MFTIDQHQLETAVEIKKTIVDDVNTFLTSYTHKDDLQLVQSNSFFFKIMNQTTLSGFQVCVSPRTYNLEIYNYVNNKKNIVNINLDNKIKNSNDVINYLLYNLQYKDTIIDQCKNVYNQLKLYFSNTNFEVTKMNYIIKIVRKNTNNGYYIYFNNNSFANIGTIRNRQYFNTNSKIVDNYDDLEITLEKLIKTNYHDTTYYNMINTKYLDCDMEDYMSNIVTNTPVTQDQEQDPV